MIKIIDTLDPMGNFPVAKSKDIENNGERLDDVLDKKVDKVTGKGLSSNDFTTSEKNKLASIAENANHVTVDSEIEITSSNAVMNSAVAAALNSKSDVTTVSNLTTRVNTAEINISTQTARIDAIVSTPSGSTEGNAELIDIRVAADGKTYSDAGTAVRSQVSNLKSEISELSTYGKTTTYPEVSWNSGFVQFNGLIDITEGVSYSNPIPVKKGDTVIVSTSVSYCSVISTTAKSTIDIGDIITPVKLSGTTSEQAEYEYTFTEDTNVVLCVSSSSHSEKILVNSLFSSELESIKLNLCDIENVSKDVRDINRLPKYYLNNTSMNYDGTLNIGTANGYCVTDYIEVNSGDLLAGWSGTAGFDRLNYYNKDKEFVSSVQYGVAPSGDYVPSGIKYVRFQTRVADLSKTYIYINPHTFDLFNVGMLRIVLDRLASANSGEKYTILLSEGTYAVDTVLTAAEINNAEYSETGFCGLVVPNNVTIKGKGNKESTIVSCTLDSTYPSNKREQIATLNLKGNTVLENITVKSSGIRYPIHDDFSSNKNATHINRNCDFIAGLNGNNEKTSGYGLGTVSGQKVTFEDCFISPHMIYHNNVGFTHPSVVTLTNSEVEEVLSLWDFNCEVKCKLQLNNVKAFALAHSYNGTHNQTIDIRGIGEHPKYVIADNTVNYVFGNCEKYKLQYDGVQGGCVKFSDQYSIANPLIQGSTDPRTMIGVELSNASAGEYCYIQTNGIISGNRLYVDTSTWKIGDYVTNTNQGVLGITDNYTLAIGKVINIIDGTRYIELF